MSGDDEALDGANPQRGPDRRDLRHSLQTLQGRIIATEDTLTADSRFLAKTIKEAGSLGEGGNVPPPYTLLVVCYLTN